MLGQTLWCLGNLAGTLSLHLSWGVTKRRKERATTMGNYFRALGPPHFQFVLSCSWEQSFLDRQSVCKRLAALLPKYSKDETSTNPHGCLCTSLWCNEGTGIWPLVWSAIKTSGLMESASLMKHFALMWSDSRKASIKLLRLAQYIHESDLNGDSFTEGPQ